MIIDAAELDQGRADRVRVRARPDHPDRLRERLHGVIDPTYFYGGSDAAR
jgi:hypothetical protein